MIIHINKAILHVLDAEAGVCTISEKQLEAEGVTEAYLSGHMEKTYDDSSMRKGEFTENSSFLYYLKQYVGEAMNFENFSAEIAHKLYDAIAASEKIESCTLAVCDCEINARRIMAALKLNHKQAFASSSANSERTNLLLQHPVLPTVSQRLGECAYIDLTDYSIQFKGKKASIDGEAVDLIADAFLECVYDISVRESFNAVSRIAKSVAKEFGGDGITEEAQMKKYIKETAAGTEQVEVQEVAEAVFTMPSARSEFVEKTRSASVPETFEMNQYVMAKANKNIKITTDTGIELSFPAEFYRDDDNISIINNEDGTISIQINNVGQIINK